MDVRVVEAREHDSRPPASITCVVRSPADRAAHRQASRPTATMRPVATASACAGGRAGSTVWILRVDDDQIGGGPGSHCDLFGDALASTLIRIIVMSSC